MAKIEDGPFGHLSESEKVSRDKFLTMLRETPVVDRDLMTNLGLFMNRKAVTRLLYMHHLYQKLMNVHGVVMEFGVHWGQTLALYSTFRALYEPYNFYRKLIGFDTFEGFPSVHDKDGAHPAVAVGSIAVTKGYEDYLERLLQLHEDNNPLPHTKKFELIKGDVVKTLPKFLADHPETIVAMAHFDLDLYEPTKVCLERLKPHLTKGSVLAFDELSCDEYPGETLALREVFGLDRFRIERVPMSPRTSFAIFE